MAFVGWYVFQVVQVLLRKENYPSMKSDFWWQTNNISFKPYEETEREREINKKRWKNIKKKLATLTKKYCGGTRMMVSEGNTMVLWNHGKTWMITSSIQDTRITLAVDSTVSMWLNLQVDTLQ